MKANLRNTVIIAQKEFADHLCKLQEASIYSAMLCKDKNIDEWIDATESMYNRIVN